MDKSIFSDKRIVPTDTTLSNALGRTFPLWKELADYTKSKLPHAIEEWNYPGEKYGWSFRIKDRKRVIIYLLPRDKFFKVGMVFSKKATDQVVTSSISKDIMQELTAARAFAEGKGIRIDVIDKKQLVDIKQMIDIKLAN